MHPTHLITPDEVDAWLADSVNKVVTFHRTTRWAAHDIVRSGADITRSHVGSFGQGFYTATRSDAFFGEAEVAVAVRIRRPLLGHLDEIEEQMDDFLARLGAPQRRMTPDVAAAVRQELLRLGYDGILIQDAGGDGVDFVIALENQQVKAVQP